LLGLQRDVRVFISDCEGPISLNDNAFEIAAQFLHRGEHLFSLISKYDDVIADLIRRPDYKAGYTLALITPFLKCHGVTNKQIEEYSETNISLVRGAEEMLKRVKNTMPSYIVSTSYEQYLTSLCNLMDFPYENVYCTSLNLDGYFINDAEERKLKMLENEISSLAMIDLPEGVTSINQLSKESLEIIKRLDRIFWEEISGMDIGRMLKEIKPIGGEEKATAVRDIVQRIQCDFEGILYVGDSITDVQALQLVRRGGGLSISFNGNGYAVRNSDIAVMAENALITYVLAKVFRNTGKKGVIKLVEEWSYDTIQQHFKDELVLKKMFDVSSNIPPRIEVVDADNVDRLVEESGSFRKILRGKTVGTLG